MKASKASKGIRVALVVALGIGIATAAGYGAQFDPNALQRWLEGAGPVAPVVFILVYTFAAVALLPFEVRRTLLPLRREAFLQILRIHAAL